MEDWDSVYFEGTKSNFLWLEAEEEESWGHRASRGQITQGLVSGVKESVL